MLVLLCWAKQELVRCLTSWGIILPFVPFQQKVPTQLKRSFRRPGFATTHDPYFHRLIPNWTVGFQFNIEVGYWSIQQKIDPTARGSKKLLMCSYCSYSRPSKTLFCLKNTICLTEYPSPQNSVFVCVLKTLCEPLVWIKMTVWKLLEQACLCPDSPATRGNLQNTHNTGQWSSFSRFKPITKFRQIRLRKDKYLG